MAKRAILLGRVSTTDQAENGYSLPTQLEAMRKYAAEHDFEVTAEITDDCSGSIPVAERPGGAKVYKALQSRTVDVVICYTIDRSARDKRDYPIEFLIFLRDVQDAGAELHFVDSGKSEGSLIDLFRAWQAGEERKKIRERTMRGKVAKAKAGKWVGSNSTPFGYRRAGQGKSLRLEIHEAEAEVVRRIFALYVGANGEKSSLIGIPVKLTREGVPTPSRSRQGVAWYSTTVKRILRNPAYIGEFYYAHKTVTISLPELAIIERETWDAAQRQFEKNKRYAQRNNKKNNYLLRGFMKCACHLVMRGMPATADGKRYLYYCCGRTRGDRHIYTCKESYIRTHVADALVWDWVYGLTAEDRLEKGIEDWKRRDEDQINPKRSRLKVVQEKVIQAERKVKRFGDDYEKAVAEGNDSLIEIYQDRHKRAITERDSYTTERDCLLANLNKTELTPEREASIRLIVKVVRDRLGDGDFEQKRWTLELFNFSAQLGYQDGQRGLFCSCSLMPDPEFLAIDSHSSASPCG